ncbi:MAG: CinA family nicotinamide mononucleotide deamidase-related protein [Tannerellaceae bacterium]|jgi:nicotinamide-nucleotide amidase|nr:CinA family nicotinamide mononucleotide deamidase-related protein [Tannerellaceae bacterium]
MNVEIITIGDELLIGQVIDTNSAWMGEQLEKEGFRVVRKTAVGDVEEAIWEALDSALRRSPVVLLTGGIGPTKDDITRATLCKYFGSELHFSEVVYEDIQRIFAHAGRPMNELTRLQAMVPDRCTLIRNLAGTAPCTWFEREGRVVASMPGVPHEMQWLMSHELIPRLKAAFPQDVFIRHHTVWVSGYGESALAMELEAFEAGLPPCVKLAYLPQPGLVRLRLSAYTESAEEGAQAIAREGEKLAGLLSGHIISEEDKAPEVLIGELLLAQGLTMATAESCTGGRIAGMITSVPGSSRYFAGGVVAYSNEVKQRALGVSPRDLEAYGAVSQVVVEQMAVGVLAALGCDCAVATSGVAGPGGGTPDKPVGTVWIAAACQDKLVSASYRFSSLREMNIARASNTALLMLLGLLAEAGGSQ